SAGVDHGAHGASVLSAEVVGLDLELLYRIRRQLNHLVGESLVAGTVGVIVHAVYHEIVQRSLNPVDIIRTFTAFIDQVGAADAGRQESQVGVVAPIQGKINNGVPVDELATIVGIGFEQRRGVFDNDALRHIADFELQIDALA